MAGSDKNWAQFTKMQWFKELFSTEANSTAQKNQ